MSTISRRAALVASVVAVAAPAAAAVAVSPDAEMICKAEAFIAAEMKKKAELAYLLALPSAQWTAADHALDDSSKASVTRYHERLGEISMAEPTTPEGLAAQATVMLWHFQEPCGDDECHTWDLAESVLRVLGKPLPEWVTDEPDAGREPSA